MYVDHLWMFLPLGFAMTIAIELPVLYFFLSKQHSKKDRLFAGFMLTACTYPIVVLVMPLAPGLEDSRFWYLLVAETFAPGAECILFRLGFFKEKPESIPWRDYATITIANLLSFGLGELITHLDGWKYILPA